MHSIVSLGVSGRSIFRPGFTLLSITYVKSQSIKQLLIYINNIVGSCKAQERQPQWAGSGTCADVCAGAVWLPAASCARECCHRCHRGMTRTCPGKMRSGSSTGQPGVLQARDRLRRAARQSATDHLRQPASHLSRFLCPVSRCRYLVRQCRSASIDHLAAWPPR